MRIGNTVYCDYQAATPIDPRVLKVMHDAETQLFANPHSADHVLGWRASAAIDEASTSIADFFGLDGSDLVFTSGASEANSMAVRAIEQFGLANNRNEIIIGAGDHASVRHVAEATSLTVTEVASTSDGAPDLCELSRLLSESVAGVSLIGVNNENGAVTDLDEVSKLCRDAGVLSHFDLAQVPLAKDVDFFELDASFATLSSHKIYGPRGIGALLTAPIDRQWLTPIIFGGGQQSGLRGGTVPTALCLGFAESIRILKEEGANERLRVKALRDMFVQELTTRNLGCLLGPKTTRHPGNALIHFGDREANDLLSRLQPEVAASSQSACSSGSLEPSRVVQAMGYNRKTASETVRFSFGRFSDEEQILSVVNLLAEVSADREELGR